METPTDQAWLKAIPKIWLGSSSTSRRGIMDELAAEFQFTYESCSADIDEQAIRHADPTVLVSALAEAKAEAIKTKLQAMGHTDGLLLTCDQVVVHERMILEKPVDREQAAAFIKGYSRSPAKTVGSVMCSNLATGKTALVVDVTEITFSPIPEANIVALIDEGEVFWCAGALMVEHALVAPHVVHIQGGMDAVMGLSKASTLKVLREAAEPVES